MGAMSSALHRLLRHAALLAAMTGAGQPIQAAPEPLHIETIQSAPFGHVDANGAPSGMMFEIGNLIAERAGLTAQNLVVPYARTVVSLRTGSADMVIRFSNEELLEVAVQVERVLSMPTVVISLAGARVTRLADLAGATVAVARSAPLDPELAAVPGIRFELVQNNEMSVRMVAAGRVKAAFGSRLGLLGAAHHLGLAERFAPPLALGSQDFWMHVSRKTATPALIEALRRGLASAQRDGSLEQIHRRYEAELLAPPPR
jgi:ABC-type amino acid transport substrate-binding protein